MSTDATFYPPPGLAVPVPAEERGFFPRSPDIDAATRGEFENRTIRIIGVLILMQMVASGLMNYLVEGPLFHPPGFLVNSAAHPQQIGMAVLFGLTEPVLWVGIAITVLPMFYQRAGKIALWMLALAVVSLAVAVMENIGVMSMISLSQAYTKASIVERGQIEAVQVIVASARNWPHFIGRIFLAGAMFVFYAVLYRFALVPRVIIGLGMIASVLMAVSLSMPIFGHAVVFPLLAPIGLTHLVVAVWLLTKGFRRQSGLLVAPPHNDLRFSAIGTRLGSDASRPV